MLERGVLQKRVPSERPDMLGPMGLIQGPSGGSHHHASIVEIFICKMEVTFMNIADQVHNMVQEALFERLMCN